jgi:zinc transporter ZupT
VDGELRIEALYYTLVSMTFLLAVLASIAAFAGGYMALRFQDKLHIILGLSAGTVMGAALFDLIPEALELTQGRYDPHFILTLTGVGFFLYLILDRLFSFHSHDHSDEGEVSHPEISNHVRGGIGAASFSLHSLIDGIAIGLAFQASVEIGIVVALAVVAHRFSDGINTIGVILKHKGEKRHAWLWLTVVALAPVVGAALTYLMFVPLHTLAILLAVFSGFFLYIGASDLIPEGHHSHSKILTTLMTLLGAGILYTIIHFVHV